MSDMIHDFGVNKVEKLKRSRWSFPMDHITNFRQGALFPICWMDVIPSSTIKLDLASLVRLALTPAKPVMGDMYFTYGAYFVPYRILFKDYEQMFGDGKPSEWSTPTEYVMPTVAYQAYGNTTPATLQAGYDAVVPLRGSVNQSGYVVSAPGNLANYLGLPETILGQSDAFEISLAPFAAYERIWSDFWRDENYQNVDPDLEKIYNLTPGSTGTRGSLRLELHYANRFHDYFTSLLPAPQKGPSVGAVAPLITFPELSVLGINQPLKLGDQNGNAFLNGTLGISGSGVVKSGTTAQTGSYVDSTNLGVDLSVDSIRNAFALQRAKERNGRTGSRYVEALLGTFEAHLDNSVAQRAEFLGGNTINLNMTTVPSTGTNPGKLGAFSATGGSQSVFVKTFNEPGIIMLVGTVRVKHHYPQSLSKFWQKTRRYDFYDPAFAHISEQPIYRKNIHVNSDDDREDVIGFNEAWVEYRKPIDLITGNLRYKAGQDDINAWTFQDGLSKGSVVEPETYYPEQHNEIAKTCIDFNNDLPDFVFIGDFKGYFDITAPMPIYSIPGLIDHIVA